MPGDSDDNNDILFNKSAPKKWLKLNTTIRTSQLKIKIRVCSLHCIKLRKQFRAIYQIKKYDSFARIPISRYEFLICPHLLRIRAISANSMFVLSPQDRKHTRLASLEGRASKANNTCITCSELWKKSFELRTKVKFSLCLDAHFSCSLGLCNEQVTERRNDNFPHDTREKNFCFPKLK